MKIKLHYDAKRETWSWSVEFGGKTVYTDQQQYIFSESARRAGQEWVTHHYDQILLGEIA